ncbi:MAG: T9SS type A sorting domain-containing protein [Cryomorphaceae bacterium]|nr:T9SS type A sorting domain-containing protein [Cryomorphaceae bacterium]
MKKILILLFSACCGIPCSLYAQSAHSVTLASMQDSLLIADAGQDTAFTNPNDLNAFFLGGNPTAFGGTPPYRYEWRPSTALSNDTLSNPQISNQTVGQQIYQLTVFDDRNCTAVDSVMITLLFISSVDKKEGASLKLYPNPASSRIVFETPFRDGTLRLKDSNGRVLEQTNVTEYRSTINIQHLPIGVYLIEYTGNGLSLTEKFIIQR